MGDPLLMSMGIETHLEAALTRPGHRDFQLYDLKCWQGGADYHSAARQPHMLSMLEPALLIMKDIVAHGLVPVSCNDLAGRHEILKWRRLTHLRRSGLTVARHDGFITYQHIAVDLVTNLTGQVKDGAALGVRDIFDVSFCSMSKRLFILLRRMWTNSHFSVRRLTSRP
jgi:hypothetical protein